MTPPKKPGRGVSPKKAPAATEHKWIDTSALPDSCDVTPEEYARAAAAARKDLVKGKKPVPKGQTPHLLLTIGAPGSGKHTLAAAIAAGKGDYVIIDVDAAVKYHPRYRGLWKLPDAVTGAATSVGSTSTWFMCGNALFNIFGPIVNDFMEKPGAKYNIVLLTHDQIPLINAKLAGYRVTLLYVGVPLSVAVARSRSRAVKTGKFLTSTLERQTEVVESMWEYYKRTAAWYGLWADEFLVADNRQESKSDEDACRQIDKHVTSIPLHCADWAKCLKNAQDAIDAACRD